jgi:hypothetical protein
MNIFLLLHVLPSKYYVKYLFNIILNGSDQSELKAHVQELIDHIYGVLAYIFPKIKSMGQDLIYLR